MTETLFESSELRVRCSTADPAADQWVITFDSLQDVAGLDHGGFAEGVLGREGLASIHFLASRPHWFQIPEMETALAIVRARCAGARHILVCGSSMGGYAALRFADRLHASACLAFSPQYSVDPAKAPFENRWQEHRLRIAFQRDSDRTLSGVRRTILCFDPHHVMDKLHADSIAAEIEAVILPVPRAGHVVTGHLNDIGLLAPLLRSALEGTIDLASFAREVVRRRKQSPGWLSNLARVQPAHRGRWALRLAAMSVASAPDNPVTHDTLAIAYRAVGRLEDAVAAHQAALAIDQASLYRISLSHTLEAAGDLAGAIAVMEEVQASDPHIALHAKRASDLRAKQGDLVGARRDAAKAIALSPRQHSYRVHWLKLTIRWIIASALGKRAPTIAPRQEGRLYGR